MIEEGVKGGGRGMVGFGKQEHKNKQECRSGKALFSRYMTGRAVFEM